MIRHILKLNQLLNAAEAGEAPAGTPANIAPINEGGSPLSLNQGAEAINGLNLFGDESAPTPSADTDEEKPNTNDDADEGAPEGSQEPKADDQPDEQTDEQSVDTDGDSAEDTQDDQNESEQAPIETLSQLVDALEADPSLIEGLTDTFKADGEEITVTLADMRKGYQRDTHYRRLTQELATDRRTHEQEHTASMQTMQRELVQVGQALQTGEQLLVGELNSTKMQELRISDPAEWSAQREELGQRINGVRQLYQNASQQYDAYFAKQQEQATLAREEMRTAEMANLQTALPEWNDDLRNSVVGYLDTSYGYSGEDLSNLMDSRMIVIANKARLYDEMQKVGDTTKKKVVKVPKVQAPGKGGRKGPNRQSVNVANAKKRLKGSGKLRDAAELIGLTMKH